MGWAVGGGEGGGMEESGAGVLPPDAWRAVAAATLALEDLGGTRTRDFGGAFGFDYIFVSRCEGQRVKQRTFVADPGVLRPAGNEGTDSAGVSVAGRKILGLTSFPSTRESNSSSNKRSSSGSPFFPFDLGGWDGGSWGWEDRCD